MHLSRLTTETNICGRINHIISVLFRLFFFRTKLREWLADIRVVSFFLMKLRNGLDNLSTNLIGKGFKANAHDPCIFNKDYDGDQLTILVYVDDLMIACKKRKCIDCVVTFLKLTYTKVLT